MLHCLIKRYQTHKNKSQEGIKMKVWVNGAFCENTVLHDRGLFLGLGVFETIHMREGEPLFVKWHYERLVKGCEFLDIAWQESDILSSFLVWGRQLKEICSSYFEGGIPQDVALRFTTTVGKSSGRSVALSSFKEASCMVHLSPFAWSQDDLSAVLTNYMRFEKDEASSHKLLSYHVSSRALDEAGKHNKDEALLLNSCGNVCSASLGNIFIIKGKDIITPPLKDGALPGIVRRFIAEASPSCGLSYHERSLSKEDVKKADALVISNSIKGVRLVSHVLIEGHDIVFSQNDLGQGLKQAYKNYVEKIRLN